MVNAMEPTTGFVLRLVATMIYGAAALVLAYAAVNDLLQGRAGTVELIQGGLGVAGVVIAVVYLSRSLRGRSEPES
jgi:hypothetical protein